MQLELKNELVEDRDRLRASLEASDDAMHRATLQVERYKQKLEEVTKECNFLRSGVDKSDHTFNNQRNMIRDLRTTNEALEASVKDLKTRYEALEASAHKARENELELEACRKQLLLSNQENEQLKQNTYQLTTVRRELETTSRELQSKAELENTYRENRVELEVALRQVDFTNRELKSRTQALETLQRESDAVSASARTLSAELSTSRTDLAHPCRTQVLRGSIAVHQIQFGFCGDAADHLQGRRAHRETRAGHCDQRACWPQRCN